MSKWELIFFDNFDQKQLNLTKWNYVEAGDGFGNKELQYYTSRSKNIFIRNNQLVIKAYKESFQYLQYTSAKITTKDKFSFQYGMVEVKVKLPIGKGIWPAIWMMPSDRRYGGWPSCGEIDIMEIMGCQPEKIYGTIHFGLPHSENGPRYYISDYDKNQFYTFKIIWEKEKISWFVDDYCYGNTSDWFSKRDIEYPYPAPFNQPFYLIINLAIGGKFPGNPDDTTIFPQEYIIDYVKVYQRKESD